MKKFLSERAHRGWLKFLSETEEQADAAEASAEASGELAALHKQAQDAAK